MQAEELKFTRVGLMTRIHDAALWEACDILKTDAARL